MNILLYLCVLQVSYPTHIVKACVALHVNVHPVKYWFQKYFEILCPVSPAAQGTSGYVFLHFIRGIRDTEKNQTFETTYYTTYFMTVIVPFFDM